MAPPIIHGTKLTTAKKMLNIQKNHDNTVIFFPCSLYILIMESLVKLIVIIFLIIYFLLFAIELTGLIFLIEKFYPMLSGWWYCLWIPIIMSANWLLTMLVISMLSRIGSKS